MNGTIRRTPIRDSGGAPSPVSDCSGLYSIDMDAFAAGVLGETPLAGLRGAGTVVDCQWFARDNGLALLNNVGLSDALECVVCP